MNNLKYSLNATMPVFLLMVLGWVLHQIGWLDDVFAKKMNSFVFRLLLPVMVFQDLAKVDVRAAWDTKYVFYCFGATLVSILLSTLIARFAAHTASERGEFIQASYRSSAAILGMAYIQNMYNDASIGPLMIIGAVPLYNIAAVAVLSLTAERDAAEAASGGNAAGAAGEAAPGNISGRGKLDPALVKKTLIGIVTNPILIGIVIGLIWSLLRIPLAGIPATVVASVARTATPLGLLSMGASIRLGEVKGELAPSLAAVFMKLIGIAAIFLPAAVALGFRSQKLIAILVMLASPTTVACYVMAKNMGHRGVLTSNAVAITTVVSSFTLTAWIWLLRTLGFV